MRTTLRDLSEQRWTAIAFALVAFALTLLQSIAYFRLAGHTFAERAAFGYSLSVDAFADAALFRPPMHPETVAGYVELRAFQPLAILFAAWATVSASSHRVGSRAAAFVISAVVAAVAASVGVLIGVSSGGESVGFFRVVEAGLLLVALAIACYAISLVVARVSPAPIVVAGTVMLILFFLNSLSRVFAELEALRWLSPFRYYDLSSPLPAGGQFDLGGLAVLLAISVVGITIAAVISPRIGRVLSRPRVSRLLGVPVIRTLYPMRIALAAWCIAFAVLGFVLVVAARTSMQDLLNFPTGLPGLRQYIFVFYADVLDQMWFTLMVLMLAALVFTFVARWADDDGEGRLEAVLSAPYSRSAAIVERLAALGLSAAVLSALSGGVVALTSLGWHLSFDTWRLVEACVVLVLFAAVLGAVGSLLTSWAPRAATILLGFVLLAAYLDDQIGSALNLPAWAQNISPFRLAGAPLVSGVDGRSVALFLLLTLAAFGSSILAFRRHDVGAWSPTKSSQART